MSTLNEEFAFAMESLEYDVDAAYEGLLADPEASVTTMIDKVRANLQTKVTTPEKALGLLTDINDQIAHFNEVITSAANAANGCQNGEISTEEMLSIVRPLIADLKDNCIALNLCDCVNPDASDITDTELNTLREFMIGAKDAAEERYDELSNMPGADRDGRAGTIVDGAAHPEADLAGESFMEYFENMAPANEVFGAARVAVNLRVSMEAKTALSLFKQAKSFHKLGQDNKAIPMMDKSRKLYETLLKKAQKNTGSSVNYLTDLSSKADKKYHGSVDADTIAYFEDRIASCIATVQKWKNKSDKGSMRDLKRETKDTLKANRQAKRAAATESMNADELIDMLALEGDLDLDLSEYDSYDDALEAMAMEGQIELMLIEDGLDPDED